MERDKRWSELKRGAEEDETERKLTAARKKEQCATSGGKGVPRSETTSPFLLEAKKWQESRNALWEF